MSVQFENCLCCSDDFFSMARYLVNDLRAMLRFMLAAKAIIISDQLRFRARAQR